LTALETFAENDRLPHRAVVIPFSHPLVEIIILKFNLFLSNICSGAFTAGNRAVERRRREVFDSMALGVGKIFALFIELHGVERRWGKG
jgi:hypothetical protein